jgi:Skp family chaperone for outer membrane proteins
MLLQRLKAQACVFLVVGLLVGGAGAFWRFGSAPPAAAATRPAEGPSAGGGRSGAQGHAAADRPGTPEEPGPAPPTDAAPHAQADRPLGAPPRALVPPAGERARPSQSRIGLINMSRALKGCRKFQALQADLRARTKQAQKKLEGLTREARALQIDLTAAGVAAARRDESAKRIVELKRRIEDEQRSAQARLTRQSGEAFAALYRDIEDAAKRVAALKGLELVLFYTDAVTEADYYNPANLQRKMTQPGALMPIIVAAPGMDVTDTVIEVLNRRAAGAKSPRP